MLSHASYQSPVAGDPTPAPGIATDGVPGVARGVTPPRRAKSRTRFMNGAVASSSSGRLEVGKAYQLVSSRWSGRPPAARYARYAARTLSRNATFEIAPPT